jgi:hypothetical protein
MEHLVLVDQGRLKRELPHVGASSAILKMMRVGWVADSGQRYGGHAYNDALAQARIHHVAVIVPGCHQRWLDDEITLTFLSSCGPPLTDGANDVNENSLVVLLQYRTLRVLFMGDAGFQSEERLLAEGVDVHADIRHPTSDIGIRHPESGASWFGLLLGCRIHRRRPSSHCNRLRRPSQPLRPSGTCYAGDAARDGSFDLSDGPATSAEL